jgi:hypothetical protein
MRDEVRISNYQLAMRLTRGLERGEKMKDVGGKVQRVV